MAPFAAGLRSPRKTGHGAQGMVHGAYSGLIDNRTIRFNTMLQAPCSMLIITEDKKNDIFSSKYELQRVSGLRGKLSGFRLGFC